MKVFRPGLKPLFVDEPESQPEPAKGPVPLPSPEEAMKLAEARHGLTKPAPELIPNTAPQPLIDKHEAPADALSLAEQIRVENALLLAKAQEAAATSPATHSDPLLS